MSKIKKKSCRKRKLEYIREKNHYRLGRKGSGYLKVSVEMIDDVDFLESFIMNESSHLFYNLSRKFKMKFRVTSFDIAMSGEDFIRDIRTVKYYFKTNLNNEKRSGNS